MLMSSIVWTQYTRATDGRTDRHRTARDSSTPRYAYTSRGKNQTVHIHITVLSRAVPVAIVRLFLLQHNGE